MSDLQDLGSNDPVNTTSTVASTCLEASRPAPSPISETGANALAWDREQWAVVPLDLGLEPKSRPAPAPDSTEAKLYKRIGSRAGKLARKVRRGGADEAVAAARVFADSVQSGYRAKVRLPHEPADRFDPGTFLTEMLIPIYDVAFRSGGGSPGIDAGAAWALSDELLAFWRRHRRPGDPRFSAIGKSAVLFGRVAAQLRPLAN